MKPKHIILICSILFILLSFVGFNFVNNYLMNSNTSTNVNTENPIIVCNARGVYGDAVNDTENSYEIQDINTENINPNIGAAEQIRKIREDFPDKVVPPASKQDREKVIECVKKYLREEEERLKNKEFEFDDEFEVILDKNKEGYFYAFFSIYHKTSYSERKKSGVIMNVKKNKDNTYEVFDICIYW